MATNNLERLKKMNTKDMVKAYKIMLSQNKRRLIIGAIVLFVISIIIGGFFAQLFGANHGTMSFFGCFKYAAISSTGRFITIFSYVILLGISAIFLIKNLVDQESDPIKNILYSDRGTYGTSRYLKPYEYAEFLDVVDSACETDGIIFGTTEDGKVVAMKMGAEVTNRNVFGTGSQGTGKSRGLIRCMIMQSAVRGASMVIMDTKSELTSDCAAYLKRKGYHVAVWNLVNLWNSNGWNILGEFEDENKIPTIVNTIILNSGDGKGDFFDNIETVLLEALCRFVYETYPKGKKNIGEAYNILRSKSPEEIDAMFNTLREQDALSKAVGCYILFSGSGSNKGNAILGLGSRLRIFEQEMVKQITGKSDINLEDIAKEKTALFLVMSASDQTYNMLGATMITLLFDSIFKYAQTTPYQRCDVPVEFILDEFPNVGYINGFAQKLGVARSYDIGIHIMIQNIPQFYDRYEQNKATEILGGCNYNLYLGCNEATTSKYYSELMGNATQKVRTEKIDGGGIIGATINGSGTSQGDGQRPVEYEDELRRYSKDELYLQVNGKKPIKLKKFDYSRHPEALLMRKVVSTELVPEWRIVNGRDISTGEIVDEDKVITTNEWLELVGSDSDKIPPIKVTEDGKTKEISRLCVEDSEQYGPSRTNLIKEAKEMKRKYASEGKTPNGQPFLADNPIAMVNPNKQSKYKGSLTRENSGSVRVVGGTIVDIGKEIVTPQKYDDEYVERGEMPPVTPKPDTSQNFETPKEPESAAEQLFSDPLPAEIQDELKTTKVEDIKPNPTTVTKEDIKPMSTELKEGMLPQMDFTVKPKKKKKKRKKKKNQAQAS